MNDHPDRPDNDAGLIVAVPPTTTDRGRIAEALYAHDHPGWQVPLRDSDVEPVYQERAAAVLAVLSAGSEATAATRAATPVKQRADCTELEWAEQERARFERLYTRESARADQAEAEAERLREQLEEAEGTAEQLVRNVHTVARDRASYRKAWKEEQQRRAKAEAQKEPADRPIDVITPADLVAALRGAGAERDRLDAADRAALERVRAVLETEAVVGRSALEYRGLITSALMADDAQQAGTQPVATAYGDGLGRVFCLRCPRPADPVPLTIEDVDDWELCPSCGRHVVDVARDTAASAGVQAVCKCPAEVCGCGHHAGVQTDKES